MAKSALKVQAQREALLQALSETANVQDSCRAAKVPRRTAYAWKAADPAFAKAWDEALDRGADALEDEAVRRAHQGVLRPVFQGGKKVGDERVYSDQLLMFLLKGARPEKYKDRGTLDLNVIPNLAGRLEAAQRRLEDKS